MGAGRVTWSPMKLVGKKGVGNRAMFRRLAMFREGRKNFSFGSEYFVE